MATLTNSRPARKPRTVKPAHGTCGLTLSINGTAYRVKPLTADPRSGVSKLVELRKTDGEVYHCSQHIHGAECTCPSWIFDRDGTGEPCKHIAALRSVGLMPPAPTPGHPLTWPTWTDCEVWTIADPAPMTHAAKCAEQAKIQAEWQRTE